MSPRSLPERAAEPAVGRGGTADEDGQVEARALQTAGQGTLLNKERLTETSLEQINANKHFRKIAQFFSTLTYLHRVPQLLKHPDLVSLKQLEGDSFGQSFLERIAKTNDRTREFRLKKIEGELQGSVPNMRNLRFRHDTVTGHPHLEAL